MSSVIQLLAMGCVCAREAVDVNGRTFYVKSRLGEGGFSYVDLVEDRRTRKSFALKRITCHSDGDQKVAVQEIEYMRALQHPNLLPCEESDVHPIRDRALSAISEVLIVMPFYRRGTLQDLFEVLKVKKDHLSEVRILELFRGVCAGLKALHSLTPNPLAHRDVKPANVLLAEDDVPVLMDFGSMGQARMEIKNISEARQLQDLAAERCSMPYRAPELFNVESHCTVDERVDIWSLGCTLYAMCFHESPFDKAYQRGDSIALAVLGGNIKFPDNNPYSVEVRELILSMLVVNAMERPYIDAVISQLDVAASKATNRI